MFLDILDHEFSCQTLRTYSDCYVKYEDKNYGICHDIDTDYIYEVDEDQHYSGKKSKFDPWQVLLLELIDAYKTLSMKVYNIQ